MDVNEKNYNQKINHVLIYMYLLTQFPTTINLNTVTGLLFTHKFIKISHKMYP